MTLSLRPLLSHWKLKTARKARAEALERYLDAKARDDDRDAGRALRPLVEATHAQLALEVGR